VRPPFAAAALIVLETVDRCCSQVAISTRRQAGLAGGHRRSRPRSHDLAQRKRVSRAGAIVPASNRRALRQLDWL